MKTDRELLELAAKAADVPFKALPHSGSTWEKWNPLTDDGDALRLAVTLCLQITFYPSCHEVEVTSETGRETCELFNRGDDAEGTRRAIVRAAAAIGEAMP